MKEGQQIAPGVATHFNDEERVQYDRFRAQAVERLKSRWHPAMGDQPSWDDPELVMTDWFVNVVIELLIENGALRMLADVKNKMGSKAHQ